MKFGVRDQPFLRNIIKSEKRKRHFGTAVKLLEKRSLSALSVNVKFIKLYISVFLH